MSETGDIPENEEAPAPDGLETVETAPPEKDASPEDAPAIEVTLTIAPFAASSSAINPRARTTLAKKLT